MATLPWLGAPDWSGGITETLEWKTDVLQSPTGAEQRIARRLTPRRYFELTTVCAGAERGAFENWLARAGSMEWAMPLWPDVAQLTTNYAAGKKTIGIPTGGREFVNGAEVLLQSRPGWLSTYEICTISGFGTDWMTFAEPLQHDWSTGALVYPLRPAVLTDPPSITRRGPLASAQVRFRIAARNGVRPAAPPVSYLGFPVIQHTSDYRDDLSAEYQRLLLTLDNSVGVPYRTDTAGRPFYTAQHVWTLTGRADQRALRAMFYYLRGRQRTVWIEGDPGELVPAGDLNANHIDVEYCGLSDSGVAGDIPSRRHIAITLVSGAKYYRRVLSATRQNTTERLQLDGTGSTAASDSILSVAWLHKTRLNDDSVTWEHITDADGLATVSAVFRETSGEI